LPAAGAGSAWATLLAGVFLIASVVGPAGCGGGLRLSGSDRWPFAPASLRIHPLTHVAAPRVNAPMPGVPPAASGANVLEVFVELLDEDGFETRGIGTLTVTATARGDSSLPVLSWTIDLSAAHTNRMYFDWVTRTYRMPLVLEWSAPPRTRAISVGARLSVEGSGSLSATAEIRWPDGA